MWKMEMEGVPVEGSGNGIFDPASVVVRAPQGEARGAGQNESDNFSFIFDEGYSEVLKRILQYLSVNEMKALSSVSREALVAVRKSKYFSDSVEFCIYGATLKSGVLENCSFPWKRLSMYVQIRDGDGVLETLTSLQFLESVESLKLVASSRLVDSTDGQKYPSEILRRTKSLRELDLEYFSFEYLLKEVTANPELGKVISNIKKLKIGYSLYCSLTTAYDCEFLGLQFNLVTLHVGSFKKANFHKIIPKMIEQSKDTLQEINLAGFIREGWGQICCQKLRKVTLTDIEIEDMGKVEIFLRNQPAIEELKVETDSPSRLICCLEEKSSRFKKFHIKVLALETKEESVPEVLDWRIVRKMEALEDLCVVLEGPRCRKSAVASIEEFLGELPTAKVKQISIEGTVSFRNCLSRNVGHLISRFGNLTGLEVAYTISLDDAGLQAIIKSCPNLVSLELAELPKVTAYGISGVIRGSKLGVALNDLKGLRALYIWWCNSITMDSILSVTRFDSLRSFKFYHSSADWRAHEPRGFVFRILEQNPSLSLVNFFMRADGSDRTKLDYTLELETKKLYPQIRYFSIMHDYDSNEDDDSASDSDESTGSRSEDGSTDSDSENESIGSDSEDGSSESNPEEDSTTGSDSEDDSGESSIEDGPVRRDSEDDFSEGDSNSESDVARSDSDSDLDEASDSDCKTIDGM